MAESGDVDAAEIRALSAGQQRIESALGSLSETVSRKFDELGTRYVPREELTQRFTGITEHQHRQDERLTGLESGRDIDRVALEARADRVEERQRVDRTNAKITALSLLGVLVALLSIIVTHWR